MCVSRGDRKNDSVLQHTTQVCAFGRETTNLAKADYPRADASSSATKIPRRQEFLDGEWGS